MARGRRREDHRSKEGRSTPGQPVMSTMLRPLATIYTVLVPSFFGTATSPSHRRTEASMKSPSDYERQILHHWWDLRERPGGRWLKVQESDSESQPVLLPQLSSYEA